MTTASPCLFHPCSLFSVWQPRILFLFFFPPTIPDINKLWKILKEMGIPDHLTCLLRNLYAGQEATVRTEHGTNWFQIGKGVGQGYILSPCLFNLYGEYIMRKAGLEEAQAGIKISGRNINYGRKWRTKESLDESERGEWKRWLKPQHSEN